MPVIPDQLLGHRRLVGAIAIAAAIAAVAIAVVKPNPFADTITVRALFADSSGLAPIGADVRMAGTPVGRVSGRRRVGNLALVTMTIDRSDGPIAADAQASLRPRLMFEGTAYIDLSPGTPGGPPLGGAAIPPAHTHSYVSLADALGVLDPPTRAALAANARELHHTLTPRVQHNLGASLVLAPRLTADIARGARAAQGPGSDSLARAVAGLDRTAHAVATQSAQLDPLLRSAATSAAALTTAGGTRLDAALRRLPATTAAVARGSRALSGVLDRLRPLATGLVPAATRLAPTLAATRPLLRAARPVLEAATPVVADAHAALANAQNAAAPTRAALSALSPALVTFEGGLIAALERPTALGAPAYLSFLGLFAGGGGASRPFTTASDPGGAGHFMRFGFRFLTGVGSPAPPCSLLARAAPQLASALGQAGGCQP